MTVIEHLGIQGNTYIKMDPSKSSTYAKTLTIVLFKFTKSDKTTEHVSEKLASDLATLLLYSRCDLA